MKIGLRKSRSGENYFVTIPIDIMRALGWDNNTEVIVTKIENKVIIEKLVEKK